MSPRTLLCLAAMTLPAMATHPVGNINRYLSNSARTDLIGQDMWTTLKELSDDRVNKPDQVTSGMPQLPQENWGHPQLGMQGVFCAGHQTPVQNLVSVQTSEKLVVTRHQWTPAWSATYYRALPSGKPGASPLAGPLSIKETKCITPEDVFVAELEILNDERSAITVDLELIHPELKADGTGKVTFTAVTNVGGIAKEKGKGWEINGSGWLASKGDLTLGKALSLPPQKTLKVRYAFAVDHVSTTDSNDRVNAALTEADPFKRNETSFNAWYEKNVPEFSTTDPDILKLYYYRWFLVKRSIHDPKNFIAGHPYKRPSIYESPIGDWFCAVIGLPIPVQIQETRWLRDITPGKNQILNWAENVHHQYRDYLQFTPAAMWNFYKIHPDPEIRAAVAQPATDYAWKDVPVHGQPQLPVQEGSWPTGAEYQPNFYQFTKPDAWDWRHDVQGHSQGFPYAKSVRLDKAAFTIANLYGAANFMEELGNTKSFTDSRNQADRMLKTIEDKHWKDGFFYSAEPDSYALADQAACYDGFLPFLFGMEKKPQFFTAFDKFFDPAWFWTDYPITTVARNNPMYWTGNAIAGPTASSIAQPHGYPCCWNGPMWNYNNSAMCEALGSVATSPGGERYRDGWLEFHRRWSDSHFVYGDRSVPCAMEHLRPTDASNFRRQVVDYFHSAWLDSTFSYWAGIRVTDKRDKVIFDPLTKEDFELKNVPAGGKELTFVQENGTRRVLDAAGKVLAEGTAALEVK
ncbi:MGH1-like glycoside hydrolase domain-containing protein [Luteolibacter soli]|uniref:Mannosylglycerate hydrolase MGH1-like glycoside hydrolase domain-containing protein n=1 Tax=Luteolibacter soli TaxID=3135280 RepID=A0ABU9ATS4_9BACT